MFKFLKKTVKRITKKFERSVKEKEKKEEVTEKKVIPKEKEVAEKKEKPSEERKEKFLEKKETIEKKKEPKRGKLFSNKVSEKDLKNSKLELVKANVSFDVAERIVDKLKDKEKKRIKEVLRNELYNLVEQKEFDFSKFIKNKIKEQSFCTILFFGFNGSGKTTTIAKIGSLMLKQKIPVVFAAGDTFRAAAIEQISTHAEKLGIDIVKHQYRGDPAAVVFDARKHAETINGVVLADTAGRLHSDKNLIEELNKIVRINKPDMKILVLDSLTGNDILEQIEKFGETGFDALILTKVDVNEKGGSILSVKQKTKKPILFLGTGQEYKDLEKFDSEKIVKKVLE